MSEKPYEFRVLNTDDMFIMFSIAHKIGIKEFAKALKDENAMESLKTIFADTAEEGGEAEGTTNDAKYIQLGISVMPAIADTLLANLVKCKDDICELLANVSGMKVKDIRQLDIVTFAQMVIDFVKKPEFKDFVEVVSKSFK